MPQKKPILMKPTLGKPRLAESTPATLEALLSATATLRPRLRKAAVPKTVAKPVVPPLAKPRAKATPVHMATAMDSAQPMNMAKPMDMIEAPAPAALTALRAKRTRTKHSSRSPVMNTEISPAPSAEDLARRAYFIWLHRGCPEGSPEADWFQAEKELLNG